MNTLYKPCNKAIKFKNKVITRLLLGCNNYASLVTRLIHPCSKVFILIWGAIVSYCSLVGSCINPGYEGLCEDVYTACTIPRLLLGKGLQGHLHFTHMLVNTLKSLLTKYR